MSRTKKIKVDDLNLLPIMNLFSVLIPFLLSVATFQKLAIVEVNLPERSDVPPSEETPPPDDQALNLTVAIAGDYVQIVARGGMLPMVFYKEMWRFRCKSDNDTITYDPAALNWDASKAKCQDGKDASKYMIEDIMLWTVVKQTEEDPGQIQMAVYSSSDSAYLDGNQEFIPQKGMIQAGSVVATLQESSARKLKPEDYASAKQLPRSAYDELAKNLIGIHTRFIDAPDADNIIVLANDDTPFDKIINVMDRAREAGFWKISLAKLGG